MNDFILISEFAFLIFTTIFALAFTVYLIANNIGKRINKVSKQNKLNINIFKK